MDDSLEFPGDLFTWGKEHSKKCTRCGETKPRSAFHKDNRKKDGLFSYCRDCNKAANAARREKHRRRNLAGEVEPPDEKRCYDCGTTKPAAEFAACVTSEDGLQDICKPCKRARNTSPAGRESKRKSNAKRNATPEEKQKRRVRDKLRKAVKTGKKIPPDFCTDCGQPWGTGNKQREFDHTEGHEDEKWDVGDFVCHLCHSARELIRKREAERKRIADADERQRFLDEREGESQS
jgi:hypothetical protein